MRPIQFCKMHGLGNDFMVVDGTSQTISINDIPFQKFANRHTGVGFDQLLLIKPSKIADFACQIFNSDGSEAEQCGNGMRCIARFIHESCLNSNNTLRIETKSGVTEIVIHDFDHITVNMGQPRIDGTKDIQYGAQLLTLSILSMGNPHAILQVPSVDTFPVLEIGTQISTHSMFPQGINVGFMEIMDRQRIRLRTFERGAGETLACGSNSCAAVVAGIMNQLLDSRVRVELSLGSLLIEWQGSEEPVIMTGPAKKIFEGMISTT
ncbi:MAG: diaminopimelate epimerase [Gammaproteobacteria bacterium]